uniref:Uncharacterized protein n=1 Tax=Medicago truncatula TaxID=3880 RepID=A2Q2B9_MEDTR|nr:hypothetical protein MtrDRAFT_AC149801g20v2 [Medicago truncatula]
MRKKMELNLDGLEKELHCHIGTHLPSVRFWRIKWGLELKLQKT